MANRRFIDFPIASSVGDNDIILIWQSGLNKQTTKATFLSGLPENLDELNDVAISGLTNGQILRYDSVTGKWENTDQGNLDLNDLNDVSIVSPSNGQVLVYNSSTSRWENSSAGYVPYTGAVTTVNLGAQTIQAGQFVKVGGTAAQFLKANGSIDSTAYGTGSVTSVALTMPTAFTVGGSPITTAGTLAVTGAGTVGQYIRGDGSLADFPESSGGGSSVSYYLNGSVAQGTIGGVAYKELNKVPILGAGTDFTINANGYIASFITDAGDPNLLEIPAGNWNFETYFSASSGGGSPTFYVELYKVNSGGTATLIASNSTFPELIAFGTNVISYFSTLAVPTTALALTDRLAIRYYVTHSGRTITLHTEDNHLCQIITTFTTGLTALNGLTAQIQNFAVGTSGTDFAIASATATHTFNLPTASATNRGALSSADWTTFNNKTSNLGTVTSVGLSSATSGVTIGSTPVTTSGTITLAIATASGSQNGLLSSTDWTTFNGKQNALTNPITGTGTTNYLPKFTGSTTIGNSVIQEASSNIGIGVSPLRKLHVLSGTGIAQFQSSTSAGDIYLGDASSSSIDNQGIGSRGNNIVISAGGFERVTIASTGAATFSSSVTAGDNITTSKSQATSTNISVTNSSTANGAFAQISAINSGASQIDIIAFGSGSTGTIYGITKASLKVIRDNSLTASSNGLAIGTDADVPFYVFTNSSERIRVTNSGHVGIGLTIPLTKLSVKGTAANPILATYNGIFGLETVNQTSFQMGIGTTFNGTWFQSYNQPATGGGTFSLVFNPLGGNVGIGTTSPGQLLTLGGTESPQLSIISNTTTGSSEIYFGDSGAVYRGFLGYQHNGDFMQFATAATERMRITSGGNVLIGTTTNGASKLRIVGLPTSAAGLSSGDVYNLSGVLMIA